MKLAIAVVFFATVTNGCGSLNNKKGNSNQSSKDDQAKNPALTTPKVRKVWVPEKIEGDKYIEGHWMWVLERTTTWSQ